MTSEQNLFHTPIEASQPQQELDTNKINHDMTLVAGALMMNKDTSTTEQTETLRTKTPEISAEMQQTYVEKDDDAIYLFGCGDERGLTQESYEQLRTNGAIDRQEYLRGFGGLAGVSRLFAVVVSAQYPDAFANFDGSFIDWTQSVKNRIESSSNVRFALHSAETNEGDSAEFDPESPNGLGCAYCVGAGAVTEICAHNPSHADLAKKETAELLSDDSRNSIIAQANEAVGNKFFSEATGVTREDYITLGAPIMILAGERHAPADETCVTMNFHADKISSTANAHAIDRPFYNIDVTQIAEMLIRGYPELKLDPEMIFAVIDQDARATRAALASHDVKNQNATAADLEVRRYGDPQAALAYLKSL